MLNKILIGLIILVILAAGAYYFFMMKDKNNNSSVTPPPPPVSVTPPPPPPPAASETPVPDKATATFDTTAGKFVITLDGKAAPKTVGNFIKLANEGYYNGTKFHRIVKGFMIQGGDPNSKDDDPANDGQGGPGYTVPAEIGLKHNVGAISMARLPDSVNPKKDSSGSQFFIVLEESQNNHLSLDGQYTAFGYVTSGMNIVTKIGNTPVEPNPYTGEVSLPLNEVVINKITIEEIK